MPKKKKTTPAIVREFENYFGSGTLEDWQRLCRDVGLGGDLGSITKCRKALRGVCVNIYDLLDAVKMGGQPHRFRNRHELAEYTVRTGRIYPKIHVKEMGPVRALLRHVL
ncbi:hypothetical protein VTK56DRAFT_3310 [Thermocarpiscus australiensis]